ncbi:outer membrane beta-barrel domain-containing protein [Saccharophagus sp. K07]|jgi:outer membrane beta-barrel protein|uniref:outer membrane beta-barrel domain-containing protein n=1 Tax=Saccharophagus sp. K07 TaxID=2283636 RepID=UPI0016525140|nr:outer membrane beta-barrel domain-containing protein [Saccharophagus sp. K07]MBC6906482.1 outer membrane beta-barrel domain-containing protein [Saccharophagus sp. K07]
MESWIQRAVLTLALMACSATGLAQQDRTVLDDVISPDLERRTIDEDKLDTENLEIGFYAGVISVEDFGSNDVFGARIGLAITEDFFLEANVASATLSETSYEELSGDVRLLSDKDREMVYYNLGLGINLFPGEVYIGRWAFNSNIYLIGGAGNTKFVDTEFFTYYFGGGWRLFLTDWLALRMDFRNHVMEHELFGEPKKIQNLEGHMGLSLFF